MRPATLRALRSRCSASLSRIQAAFSCKPSSMSRSATQRGALTDKPSAPTTKPIVRRRERFSA
jgi:hypothetical protein